MLCSVQVFTLKNAVVFEGLLQMSNIVLNCLKAFFYSADFKFIASMLNTVSDIADFLEYLLLCHLYYLKPPGSHNVSNENQFL